MHSRLTLEEPCGAMWAVCAQDYCASGTCMDSVWVMQQILAILYTTCSIWVIGVSLTAPATHAQVQSSDAIPIPLPP